MKYIVETGYAYPSSYTAKKYGCARTGCYYYALTDARKAKPRAEVYGGGYATHAEAETALRQFLAGFLSSGGVEQITEERVGAHPFLRVTVTTA